MFEVASSITSYQERWMLSFLNPATSNWLAGGQPDARRNRKSSTQKEQRKNVAAGEAYEMLIIESLHDRSIEQY